MIAARVIGALALIWSITPAWGWGPKGHRIVALIAAKRLTGKARLGISQILGVPNNTADVADALADAAVWPDEVARDKYHQADPWHYLDLSLLNGANDQPDPFGRTDSAYAKIVAYFDHIRSRQTDELEPGSDLKFVVHLVGDIHQPLHTVTNQDRGGNCLLLNYPGEPVSSRSRMPKLHAAWDSGILVRASSKGTDMIARDLFKRYKELPKSEKEKLDGAPGATPAELARSWILESNGLAKSGVYGPLQPPLTPLPLKEIDSCSDAPQILQTQFWTLDSAYMKSGEALIEQQLMTGGVRLGMLLNRIWK